MNENDVEMLKKLKELRDRNALTQEEFDEQVSIYLNSNDSQKHPAKQKHIEARSKDISPSLFVIISLTLVVVITLLITLFSLLYVKECDDDEVKTTLSQLFTERWNFDVSFPSDSFFEISYDEQNKIKKCRANVIINGQAEDIMYKVKENNLDIFVSLDDTSFDYIYYKYKMLCNNKEVVSTLFEHIEERLNVKPTSLENNKEISYDTKTYERQCSATLNFDNNKETIKYSITKADKDNFSVSLDDASFDNIYYKYTLHCNNEQVISTLFESIKEDFGVTPLSVDKYKDFSYNETTGERQCIARLNFENNEKITIDYVIIRTNEDHFLMEIGYNFIKQCNILSGKFAQDVISSNYEIFKDIQLTNTKFVSKNEQEGSILCKSNTNIFSFPKMYYKLYIKDNQIYVAFKSPFKCNAASMMVAQAIIVSNYKDFENLELRNPQEIERSDDNLTCRAYTNFMKLPIMSYQVRKIEGKGIAEVYVNPVADVVDDTMGRIFKSQGRFFDME